MRVACVVMQRDETLCLHPWLAYHGYLFGYDNLFVIDHGSDDRGVRETLRLFETLGVHMQRLPASADYTQKGAASPAPSWPCRHVWSMRIFITSLTPSRSKWRVKSCCRSLM